MRAVLHLPRSAPSAPSTGRHGRHRFIRDGEVPVTVVNSRHGHAAPDRETVAELERALTAEQQGRNAAEKALEQAKTTIRQLQTRLAHAELARQEAAPPAIEQAPQPEPAKPPASPKRQHPEPDEDEAVEWWKPGWRERFRARRQETSSNGSASPS